jgi:hypothetical protein
MMAAARARTGCLTIAIASNEPFSGWTKPFTDPRRQVASLAGTVLECWSPT